MTPGLTSGLHPQELSHVQREDPSRTGGPQFSPCHGVGREKGTFLSGVSSVTAVFKAEPYYIALIGLGILILNAGIASVPTCWACKECLDTGFS